MRLVVLIPFLLLILLPICLLFAPVRPVSQDWMASASPIPHAQIENQQPGNAHKTLAQLCKEDPVEALAESLRLYKKQVEGYQCTLVKQERVHGKLRPQEVIECAFREQPFSVQMRWKEGKDKAESSLFVQGENEDQMLVTPAGEFAKRALRAVGKFYVQRPTNDRQVYEANRYTVREFGIAIGTMRTHSAWKLSQERGDLDVEYLGIQRIPEVGNRECHVLRRKCKNPEEEGMTELVVGLDVETGLQISSFLKAGKELIASYQFQNLKLNPTFSAHQFKPEILK